MKILITGDAPAWVKQELESDGHEIKIVPASAYVIEKDFIDA